MSSASYILVDNQHPGHRQLPQDILWLLEYVFHSYYIPRTPAWAAVCGTSLMEHPDHRTGDIVQVIVADEVKGESAAICNSNARHTCTDFQHKSTD